MTYGELTLGNDIRRLAPEYGPAMDHWIWEAERGVVRHHAQLGCQRMGQPTDPANLTKAEKRNRFLFSLQLYGWFIYRQTNTDAGSQIIGREGDTDPFSLEHAKIPGVHSGGYTKLPGGTWAKPSAATPKPGLNLTPQARGNVLKMDKWHPTMNDCWVLGGVHRLATFQLVSPRIPENIFNHRHGYLIVTAREILGLLHFGYEVNRAGGVVRFEPKNLHLARNANLVDYWKHIQEKSRLGAGIIREMLDRELKRDVHAEIESFDKRKLKRPG